MMSGTSFVIVLALSALCLCLADITSTPSTSSSTTTSPQQNCEARTDCGSCVSEASCLWCESKDAGQKCVLYPKRDVLPPKSLCPLKDARWGTCWVNYEALIISMAVIAGVILLVIGACCIYCCCCRSRDKARRRRDAEDARQARQEEERRAKHAERRAERESKYDEIRRKYGLTKESTYTRFDNEED